MEYRRGLAVGRRVAAVSRREQLTLLAAGVAYYAFVSGWSRRRCSCSRSARVLAPVRRLPGRAGRARKALPGTAVAAVGWLLLSRAFGIYAGPAGTYALYGALGAVLLVLAWLDVDLSSSSWEPWATPCSQIARRTGRYNIPAVDRVRQER